MDGWMNGWTVVGGMYEWMDESMNGWLDVL